MSAAVGRMDRFARARKIADAVLYEGYVLYPYRASATKNRLRWQFGVLAPRGWSEAGGCEAWWLQTECLLTAPLAADLAVKIRFLQVQRRQIEERVSGETFRAVDTLRSDSQLWQTWQEGIERTVELETPLAHLLEGYLYPFELNPGGEMDLIRDCHGAIAGRSVRDQAALNGVARLSLEILDPARDLLKLRLRIENVTATDDVGAEREDALPGFLVGLHALLGLSDGSFLSLADPPGWAAAAATTCDNQRAWPILIGAGGSSDVVLASPIILDDDPQVAPESPGDLCDATEIDEILLLRTMTLTDEEKREARATDPRAAAIVDRAESLPPEILERLHGAIRGMREVQPEPAANAPWWDPAVDASFSPDTEVVEVGGVSIGKGCRVRLRPGVRRADAQDMFLADRVAVVEGVFLDVDDRRYLAVTIEDDPAADLKQAHGRYLYFSPDEVEPLGARA